VTSELVAASWRAVIRLPLVVPAAAAAALLVGSAPVLDDGYAMQVLRGIGVLLACSLVVVADDPAGEVLAASPFPRAVRTAARGAAAVSVVLPIWISAALVVEVMASYVPVLALGVEALAYAAMGLAVGAGLRAWKGSLTPSYAAGPAVVGLALATNLSPRTWALLQEQTWGPPWVAAQIRWIALLVLGAAVLVLAVRDPLSRPRRTASH